MADRASLAVVMVCVHDAEVDAVALNLDQWTACEEGAELANRMQVVRDCVPFDDLTKPAHVPAVRKSLPLTIL